MATGRIGAEYGSVETAATSFDGAGDASQLAGVDATQHAQQSEAQLDEVTSMMRSHFEEMAADLKQRVLDHKNRLESTDWEGTSKNNAVAASDALTGEVDSVLSNAIESVDTFRTVMHSKMDEFRGAVEGEFTAAMNSADASYKEMSHASRRYVQNLSDADQNSIRFGG